MLHVGQLLIFIVTFHRNASVLITTYLCRY